MNMSFVIIRYHAFCLFVLNENKVNMGHKNEHCLYIIYIIYIFHDCYNSPHILPANIYRNSNIHGFLLTIIAISVVVC